MSKDKLDKKLENNRLILEFMGYTKGVYDHGLNDTVDIWKNDSVSKGHYRTLLECHFDWYWDELMPVISKITRDKRFIEQENREYILDIVGYGHIEDVFEAVIGFINWYNKGYEAN